MRQKFFLHNFLQIFLLEISWDWSVFSSAISVWTNALFIENNLLVLLEHILYKNNFSIFNNKTVFYILYIKCELSGLYNSNKWMDQNDPIIWYDCQTLTLHSFFRKSNSLFPIIFFIIIIRGFLIIFLYFSRLVSNEKISL